MANYILDKAYKVETAGTMSANLAVVHGTTGGGCTLPASANDGAILGITTMSALQGHYITVRKAGIASVRTAGAISRGEAVCIADSAGRIKSAGKANVRTGTAGTNNAVRWTAKTPGISGNNFILDVVVSGNNTALSVFTSGNRITLNSATNSGGTATTTASQAIAAIAASAAASLLISGTAETPGDGSGIIADETVNFSGGELGLNIIGYAEESSTSANDIIDVMLTR